MGGHLKKYRRAEGGANIFGVFRVKNHDFTPKIIFFPILGGRGAGCPPLNNGYDKIKVANGIQQRSYISFFWSGVCVFWQFCKVVKQGRAPGAPPP
jgi:Na+/citrate or Na+/malate symporter